MPPFRRFVFITSALLFFVYLMYPSYSVSVVESNTETQVLKTVQEAPLVKQEVKQQAPVVPLKSTATLREKLAYHFPYHIDSVFPAFIWQTWKYTPASRDFGEDNREGEAAWSRLHPGYIHEVITDDVAAALIAYLYREIPEVVEAYDALPKQILKADFFRYLILLARGGIYGDIDTAPIQSAWKWVPEQFSHDSYGLIIGIEADPDREDWADWYSRRVQFCQWVMKSKPGHPGLREAVSRITEETLKRKKEKSLKNYVTSTVEWTGPAMWTDAIFAYLNSEESASRGAKGNYSWKSFTGLSEPKQVGDVVVLPITGFSPGIGHMGSQNFDSPAAMVKHEFKGSWKPIEDEAREAAQSKKNTKS